MCTLFTLFNIVLNSTNFFLYNFWILMDNPLIYTVQCKFFYNINVADPLPPPSPVETQVSRGFRKISLFDIFDVSGIFVWTAKFCEYHVCKEVQVILFTKYYIIGILADKYSFNTSFYIIYIETSDRATFDA